MSSILPISLAGGYVSTGGTGRSAYDLEAGELSRFSGGYYRKNDPNGAWKIPGRSEFGDAGGEVTGVAICQFDDTDSDLLIAQIPTRVVSAPLGTTGTFSDLITGLDSAANRLTTCHVDDRWYIGNGYDQNRALHPDGTVRIMGMATPQVALTAVASSSAGAAASPTANTGSFTNPTFAYDGDSATFAGGTRSTAGTVVHTWTTWASNSNAGRKVSVTWNLAGLPIASDVDRSDGPGSTVDSGYNVTVKLEKSEDSGGTWSTVLLATRARATPVNSAEAPLTANSNLVHFRATLTYNSGTNPATLRIYEVKIQYGSTAANFDTDASIYYAYTRFNDNEQIEGAPSEITEVAAFAGKNVVTLTRVDNEDDSATHWNIYRIVEGGSKTITQLGFLKSVLISELTFEDTFEVAADEVLSETVPVVSVGDRVFPRDTQPPAFINMTVWKGGVCGISRINPRMLRYTPEGFPESWPEVYAIENFPLDEHDRLVGQMVVGETMVLLCAGAVIALESLPRETDTVYNQGGARALRGFPGLVGEYAYTSFSVAGEPRGAWVSPLGVYVTNGSTLACLSEDLAWESEVNTEYLSSAVLRWDAKNLILWFEFDFDGDGMNDSEMPFHMAPAHGKASGLPKLGQPTTKATSCMASAIIGTKHYRYSGHPSDGNVYLEEATTTGVEMVVRTRMPNRDRINVGVIKATVVHADSGEGETATLTTTTLRDDARSVQTRENSVSLYGDRKTTVFIGRAGEAVDFELTYDGNGAGGILGIQAEVDGQGRSGSANRWATSSATP